MTGTEFQGANLARSDAGARARQVAGTGTSLAAILAM